MTWVCTSDAWTCPHCKTTWGRGMLTAATWATTVVRLQLSHGATCKARGR